MKKFLTLSILSILLFFGCNQDSEILTPIEETSNKEYTLISLPTPTGGLSIETLHTVYKDIDGAVGGWFGAQHSYQSGSGMVYMSSALNFPENSFYGIKTISQTFNTEQAAITFGPSMQFNVPVYYSLKIYGVDLTGVNPETLDFVYIDANGNMYPCEYASIAIDVANGILAVYSAELNHFSRYGFVN